MASEPSIAAASEEDGGPCILCFDGSDTARKAIRETAGLLVPAPALVVHVWLRPSALMFQGRHLASTHPLAPAADEFDASAREVAEAVLADGVRLAAQCGFDPESALLASQHGVWAPIVELAEERSARAVSVGSRGVSSLESAMLGSVAHGVANHCGRPVIIVPVGARHRA
jgi:nucleotide-binding universal stress UspA family protein